MNLLLLLAASDQPYGDDEKELRYLNSYSDMFNIPASRSMPYFKTYGTERIIEDLKILTISQREFLIIVAWEMINCDGKPNQQEIQATATLFEQMGISEETFMSTVQKTSALMAHFR